MAKSKLSSQAQKARLELARLRREAGRRPRPVAANADAVAEEIAAQLERDLNAMGSTS